MPRYEGLQAHPDAEIHFAEPRTLLDLGFELGVDKLNLGNDPVTSFRRVDPESGGQWFFVAHHHPFAGEHLSQFLSNVAPNKVGDKYDVRDDFIVPQTARKISASNVGGEEEYPQRLDRIHSRDPQIGALYQELTNSPVLPRFRRAFHHSSGDSVFATLRDMAFIRSKEELYGRFFEECDRAFEEVDEDKMEDILYTARYGWAAAGFFEPFFKTQPEYQNGGDYIGDQINIQPPDVKSRLLKEFLGGLDQQWRERFALSHNVKNSYWNNGVIVDLETKEMVAGSLHDARLRFIDDETVEVSNLHGASALVRPNRDVDFGHVEWKATQYRFPPDYFTDALFPLVAWAKDANGGRRFLSQDEANPIMRKVFQYSRWADVRMGRALAAYFSPQVTKEWPSSMTLKEGQRPQKMAAAQMLIWPSIDSDEHPHASQLLNTPTSIIPSLEEFIEQEAA